MPTPREELLDPSQKPLQSSFPPMISLEQKEIRGVTFKLAWMILGSTATIVIFLITSYNKLKDSIRDTDVKAEIIKVEVGTLNRENAELKYRLGNLEEKLYNYEKQNKE